LAPHCRDAQYPSHGAKTFYIYFYSFSFVVSPFFYKLFILLAFLSFFISLIFFILFSFLLKNYKNNENQAKQKKMKAWVAS